MMGSFSLLQIVGSTIIGGFLILILFRYNGSMNEKKHRYNIQNNLETNIKILTDVIEADLNKIGYLNNYADSYATFKEPFVTANDSVFSFKTDVSISQSAPYGDGVVDQVKYYLGSAITSTPNTKDRILFREVNGGSPLELNYGVRELKFKYYNTIGDSLLPPIDFNKIAVVEYKLTIEDIYGYNYTYNIDSSERKQGDVYYMVKKKTNKIAIKNFKKR